jgi:hypothetical protein
MAFGLAVHASRCELPTPRARLASSRWSDSTGRALHPQGSDERFQSVNYMSPSSPKLACRNRIDRSNLVSIDYGVVGPKRASRGVRCCAKIGFTSGLPITAVQSDQSVLGQSAPGTSIRKFPSRPDRLR